MGNGLKETPRSKVVASLRDLTVGSNRLPWTEVIVFGTLASGQRAVIIGPGVVCSRDANGCSGRGVRKLAIAVKRVARQRDAGGVGRRASGIGRPSTAASGGGNRASGIGSDGASGKRRQLTRRRRARASAQRRRAKIFRLGPAIGRVATSFSVLPTNIRASVFAVWRADWLYVACWIAKRVTERGASASVVSA